MSEETAEVKSAVRKARAKAVIVVGGWNGGKSFDACAQQPPETTELAAAVAWAKANLPPGRYEFVRRLPQALTMAEQKLIKSVLA
jgi:hypothetical protein